MMWFAARMCGKPTLALFTYWAKPKQRQIYLQRHQATIMVQALEIIKTFDQRPVVAGINLSVPQGSVPALKLGFPFPSTSFIFDIK